MKVGDLVKPSATNEHYQQHCPDIVGMVVVSPAVFGQMDRMVTVWWFEDDPNDLTIESDIDIEVFSHSK